MTKEVKIYNREDLLKKLTQESFYIDEATLNTYLKELKIEAIFEDNNVEFFDSTSLERIIELIKNQRKVILDNSKAQSERQDEIRTKLLPADIDLTELAVNPNNSFKLDISEKTLNMVARAISKKIVRQVNHLFSGDNVGLPALIGSGQIFKYHFKRAEGKGIGVVRRKHSGVRFKSVSNCVNT